MNPYMQSQDFEQQVQILRQMGISEEKIQMMIAEAQGGQNPGMIPAPTMMQQGEAIGRDGFNGAAQAAGNVMYPNTGPVGQPSPAQYGNDLMQGTDDLMQGIGQKAKDAYKYGSDLFEPKDAYDKMFSDDRYNQLMDRYFSDDAYDKLLNKDKSLMQKAEEAAKKVKNKFNSWWDEL